MGVLKAAAAPQAPKGGRVRPAARAPAPLALRKFMCRDALMSALALGMHSAIYSHVHRQLYSSGRTREDLTGAARAPAAKRSALLVDVVRLMQVSQDAQLRLYALYKQASSIALRPSSVDSAPAPLRQRGGISRLATGHCRRCEKR